MSVTLAGASYPLVQGAYSALKNAVVAAQKISISTSYAAPDSFGSLVDIPEATVQIVGVPAGGKIPELQGGLGAYRLSFGKAILNLEVVGNVTVENLLFTGARSSESNGAGIRVNGAPSANLTVRGVIMRNNENGILANAPAVTIIGSLFDNNGQATSVDRRGYSHNVYMAGKTLTVRSSSFINSEYGHDFKSRCESVDMRQCYVGGSKNGRALDLPESGIIYAENCVFSKSATAAQNVLIEIGEEGAVGGRPEKFTFKNCEFHNDVDPARDVMFIQNHRPVAVELIDCTFTGAAAAKDESSTLRGLFNETLTGGPLGPLLPVGVPSLIAVQGIPISTPAPIPAPPQPVPAPAPAPTPAPAPAPAPAVPAPSVHDLAFEKAAVAYLKALGYRTVTK